MQKSEQVLTNGSYTEQRAHWIELLPTPEQAAYFQRACGAARFTYNWALAEGTRQYEAGQQLNATALKKQFNAMKHQQFPWLKDVHRDAHSQPFAHLSKAFQRFFQGKAKHPKFKKKGRCRDSFYVANDKLTVLGEQIRLPLAGWVKMTEPLRFGGRILNATVSKRSGRWFVSVSCEFEICWLMPQNRQERVGIDVGVKTFATLSSGEKIEAPRPLQCSLRRLRILSRKRDKRNKSAKAKAKLNRKTAPIHFRAAHIRKDFIHKLTHRLCCENQAIGYEDLHLQFMLSNRKLARATSDLGLGEFFRCLEYKAPTFYTDLYRAERNYPSSQLCSIPGCGYRFRELTLQIRFWTCPWCGTHHDRDHNAAKNLEFLIPADITAVRLDGKLSRPEMTSACKGSQGRNNRCAHIHAQER